LEDPLDIFSPDDTKRIIDFLCLEEHFWSIVIVSNNVYWDDKCDFIFELNQGKINILK
jgi:hypothetical protein